MKSNKTEMATKIPSFLKDYQTKFNQLSTSNSQLEQQLKEIKVVHEGNQAREEALEDQHKQLTEELQNKITHFNQVLQANSERISKLKADFEVLKSQCDSADT